jgi:hypothetical protein
MDNPNHLNKKKRNLANQDKRKMEISKELKNPLPPDKKLIMEQTT